MDTTTDVVKPSRWVTYRRHGYHFREAAILTILIGFGMHLCRVLFGDETALRYVVTPVGDLLLLLPMAYAAVTGIVGYRRMAFVNRPHRIALTVAIGYLTVSVPLHLYVLFVLGDVSFYVHLAGYWFSYLLLCLVYPVFLVMLARVRYKD